MSEFRAQKIRLIVDSIRYAYQQGEGSRLYLIDNDVRWSDLSPFLSDLPLARQWSLLSPWHLPYEPFLETVREWYLGLEPRRRRALARTLYPLHREILQAYLEGRILQRHEPVVNEEFEYETERWRRELSSLFLESLRDTGRASGLFVLENATYLMPSSYELLKEIARTTQGVSVFLLFYDPGYPGLKGFSVLENLIQESERREFNLALEVIPADTVEEIPWSVEEPPLERRLDLIRAQRALAAWEDILLTARSAAECDLESVEDLHRRSLLNEIVLSYVDVLNKKGEYRKAYLYANQVLKGVRDSQEGDFVVLAQIQLAVAEFRANALDSAYYYAQMALKLAQNLGNLRFQLLAELMIFHIRTGFNDIELFFDLAQKLHKARWRNWSALIRSFGGYLATILRSGTREPKQVFALAEEGIRLARGLRNELRLSTVYHAYGVLGSLTGDVELARRNFRKSLAIKRRLGDPHQLAKILNSIGYLELLQGNFGQSHRYFVEALTEVSRTRVYVEICGTLYNLGKVSLLLFRNRDAALYFGDMLRIMDKLNIQNLAFQPRVTILSLLGIASYHEGARVNAWNALQKIQRLPNYQDQAQKNAMYWLLVILLQNPDRIGPELVNRVLENAATEGYPFILYGYLCVGDHLAQHYPLQAREYWERGLALCRSERHIDWFAAHFRRRLDAGGPAVLPAITLRKVDFRVQSVLEMVDEEKNLNALERKIHEIDFISQFQNLVIVNEKRQHLVENSHLLLSLHFAHDAAVISLKPNEYYPHELELGEDWESLAAWIRLESRAGLTEWAVARGYRNVELVRVKTREDRLLALVMFSRRQHFELTADDRKILAIFLGQFDAAMELIATREALVKAAKTDKLTGLLNRLEFDRIVQNEYSRLRRYAQYEKGTFALMFLDMDNFKTCNDTFGHDIGDLVLVEFARLLRSAVREVDSVGRLGGDEFIILLPQTTKHEATVVAHRILTQLAERRSFVPEIESALGTPIDLPEHRRISCSIGIAEVGLETGTSLQEALRKADQALYAAKRAGKNRYAVAD